MSFSRADTFVLVLILFVFLQKGTAFNKQGPLTSADENGGFVDTDSLTAEGLSTLNDALQSDGGDQSELIEDIYRIIYGDDTDSLANNIENKPHTNTKKFIKNVSEQRPASGNNIEGTKIEGDLDNRASGGIHRKMNVYRGKGGDKGITHVVVVDKDTGNMKNIKRNHYRIYSEKQKQRYTGNIDQLKNISKNGNSTGYRISTAIHGISKTGEKNAKSADKLTSHKPDNHTLNMTDSQSTSTHTNTNHKENVENTGDKFDKSLEAAMQKMSGEASNDIVNYDKNLRVNDAKKNIITVSRVSDTKNGAKNSPERRHKLLKALKYLCSSTLSMCDVKYQHDSNAEFEDNPDSEDGTEDDDESDDTDNNNNKMRHSNAAAIKLLMLLNAKLHMTTSSSIGTKTPHRVQEHVGDLVDHANSGISTNSRTTKEPIGVIGSVEDDHVKEQLSANSPATKKPIIHARPVLGAQKHPDKVSSDENISPPIHTPMYAAKAVWIGIGVGTGIAWLMMLLLYGCYRCLLGYRSDRQNEQLKKLCRNDAEDSPMHIRMAKMSKDKNGNHYVVSIMDEKKKRDYDGDEEGWSSEEEVFNVSGDRGSPRTSTPVGTPVKKKTLR